MNILYNLFFQFWALLNFITTFYFMYEACLAIACFFRRKKLPEPTKYHRFAAVVAARNEEAVIGNLIESIKLQNYPKDKIDIIVVADNCDDDTAGVAERAGAIVYHRFNKVEVGKCYVLQFAYEKIFAERDVYDAFCVFDADNVVDPNFFSEMNRMLCAGFHVAQGYRDMKNPRDTWVSGGHSIFYWMQNRFYNASRSFMGLSATINGTGFMVAAPLLRRVGCKLTTLTEDLEFTMKCTLADERIGYARDAVVYDEQPLTIQQSMRQRIRWTNGYIQCFTKFIVPFLKRIVQKPSWLLTDMLLFLCFFPVMVIGCVSFLIYMLMGAFHVIDPMGFVVSVAAILGTAVFGFWAVAVASVALEHKKIRDLVKAILTYPLFNATWIVIYVVCFFWHSNEWKPIQHMRSISIKDIETEKAKS